MEDFHEHRMRVLKLRGLEDDETFNQDITSIHNKACQHSKIDRICYAEIVRTMQGIPSLLRERLLQKATSGQHQAHTSENQCYSPQQGKSLTSFCGILRNHGTEIFLRNSDNKTKLDNKRKQLKHHVGMNIARTFRFALVRITLAMRLLSTLTLRKSYPRKSEERIHKGILDDVVGRKKKEDYRGSWEYISVAEVRLN